MTRSDSKRFRMELLEYMSKTYGLVTGSETGHDAAVPLRALFRGHAEPGTVSRPGLRPRHAPRRGTKSRSKSPSFRPDTTTGCRCGNWSTTTAWSRSGIGATTTTSCLHCGDRRDLFNALYGTPPMFMFNREIWRENRDRFVESYQTATPVARATGYTR